MGLASDRELEFTLGNGEVCDALECVVASMRKHEVAVGSCTTSEACDEPRLGIVGRPGLAFHIEVLEYKSGPYEQAMIRCRDAPRDAQKLEYVEDRKEVAATLFKSGRHRLAAHRYKKYYEFLGYVDDFGNHKVKEERKDKVRELKKLCMLNRALCLLKASEFQLAAKACDIVLDAEAHNLKALLRRARARFSLEEFREA